MYQFEKQDTAVELNTTLGVIKIYLFPDKAPKTVQNFTTHVKNGYYDGLIFHRVIDGFMIQGGDPKGTGTGGESIWGRPFEDEFDHDLHNYYGALSMANAGQNTNGSQFFIVQANFTDKRMLRQMQTAGWPEEIVEKYAEIGGTPWLDYHHTVFGQVYEGMDVVDKIAKVKRNANDKPLEDVKIISAKII